MFQATASMLLPAFTIHTTVKYASKLFARYVPPRFLSSFSLCSLPFLFSPFAVVHYIPPPSFAPPQYLSSFCIHPLRCSHTLGLVVSKNLDQLALVLLSFLSSPSCSTTLWNTYWTMFGLKHITTPTPSWKANYKKTRKNRKNQSKRKLELIGIGHRNWLSFSLFSFMENRSWIALRHIGIVVVCAANWTTSTHRYRKTNSPPLPLA